MSSMDHPHHETWPRSIHDRDGNEYVLRPMQISDFDVVKGFFHAMPREDRMFLRYDVEGSQQFEHRLIETLRHPRSLRLLAFRDGILAGHGLLEPNSHLWSQHVGEVRVIVREGFKHKSLGSIILRELVDQAGLRGFDKLTARIMDSQNAVRKMCERVGFSAEAELKNHVMDLDGKKHTMVVMSCSLDDAWHAMELLLSDVAPWAR